MKRVSAHIPAAALVSLMLLATSGVAAQASFDPQPNPRNQGNHYGWYKPGHKLAPSPAPAPNPGPGTNPGTNPGSHTTPVTTGASHGSGSPSSTTPPASLDSLLTALQGVDLALLELVPSGQAANGKINSVPQGGDDPLWWLILLLVPTLAALWLIALRGLLRGDGAAKQPARLVTAAGSRAQ